MNGSKEGYKPLFDALRSQQEVSGLALWVLFGFTLIVTLVVGGSAYVRSRRRRERLQAAFRALAKEKGLTSEEERHLFEVARAVAPDQPVTLFSSLAAFERGVEHRVPTSSGGEADPALVVLIQSLRRKLGFDRHPTTWQLRHSRQIPADTRLMVGYKRGEDARFCSCVVEDNNASSIRVAPLLRGDQEALKQVKPKERLYVRFWRQGDTEYKFRSHLMEGSPAERDTLLLAHADALERVQERDFFRLPVHLPVTLYDLPNTDLAELSSELLKLPEDATKVVEGTLINVSARGCALRSDRDLPVDALFVIDPGIVGTFSLGGVVCRIIRTEALEEGLIHYLEFLNVTDAVQDRIVRELYRRQLERASR